MLPTINIGSVTIDMYILVVILGVLSVGLYVLRCREKNGMSVLQCLLFTLCCAVAGVTGMSVMLVFGGINAFGSIFLVPVVVPAFSKLFGLTASKTRDLCAIGMAIDLTFTKLACFCAGCCEGIVVYIGSTYFRWPAQILGSCAAFSVLLLLLRAEAHGKWQGVQYPLFMLIYGIIRLILDSHEYMPEFLFGLRHGQLYGIVSAVIGFVWLMIHKKRIHNVQKMRLKHYETS